MSKNSTETRRKTKLSGDMFSFPNTLIQEQDFDFNSEFEFGCITPESPSADPYKSSPADHLFFNGRLLPHSFPLQTSNNSRTTSRGSSVSSKDSLMSSRSNSTNSRSSSCSSARTSSSDNSERKFLYQKYQVNSSSSRRWQFISPAPVLNPEISRPRKAEVVVKDDKTEKKRDGRLGYGRRFFRWIMFACKECHALEPSKKDCVYCEKIKV